MSRQNPHIKVNQSGARIGIGSVENLTTDQICGSRGSGQATPARKSEQTPAAAPKPRQGRNIAIGVDLSADSQKEAKTDTVAGFIGDFVEAVISIAFGS